MFLRSFSLAFMLLLLTSCVHTSLSTKPKDLAADTLLDYSNKTLWFDNRTVKSGAKADILYFSSTDIANAKVSNGKLIYNSDLSKEDKALISEEMHFMKQAFAKGYNFFSPYYRQATLDTFLLPASEEIIPLNIAYADIKQAFLFYLKHINNNRPFVIIAFSQGSIHAARLFSDLEAESFQNLKGAYLMGYGLQKKDIENMKVKPMKSEREGIVAAFNSSTAPNLKWELITKDTLQTINPISWMQDNQKATFSYAGRRLNVHIDEGTKLLIVEGLSEEEKKSPMPLFYKNGFLHHLDFRLYNESIRKNIEKRIKK